MSAIKLVLRDEDVHHVKERDKQGDLLETNPKGCCLTFRSHVSEQVRKRLALTGTNFDTRLTPCSF